MSQAEVYLGVVKESLTELQKKTSQLIKLTSNMGLIPIDGELRRIFERLILLTNEIDNFDENYLLKRQSMLQLEHALAVGAYSEYKEYWEDRPQRLEYIPRKDKHQSSVSKPTSKEAEDAL